MAARRLRRRAMYLLAALVVAALLAAAAVFFGQQSNRNAQIAGQNLATAQSESQRVLKGKRIFARRPRRMPSSSASQPKTRPASRSVVS